MGTGISINNGYFRCIVSNTTMPLKGTGIYNVVFQKIKSVNDTSSPGLDDYTIDEETPAVGCKFSFEINSPLICSYNFYANPDKKFFLNFYKENNLDEINAVEIDVNPYTEGFTYSPNQDINNENIFTFSVIFFNQTTQPIRFISVDRNLNLIVQPNNFTTLSLTMPYEVL